MIFRKATSVDVVQIATLHSVSWQQNYRASFSAEFLDNLAYGNRLNEWKKRFWNPSDDQLVIIAEEDGKFLGFICAEPLALRFTYEKDEYLGLKSKW